MLHRRRVSSGDRRKMVLIKAHHREVGHLLGHKLPIESCARDIHPPELPVDGVTAKFERVTRNRHHQRAPRTTTARDRPNVKVPKPEALLAGMRFEGFAHKRVANQLIRDLRNQAIEPSFCSQTVPEKVGFQHRRYCVADHGGELARHRNDPCSILDLHWANSHTINLRHAWPHPCPVTESRSVEVS